MNKLTLITDDMRNNKVYGGTVPKFGITYQGREYIVKHSELVLIAV